MSWVTNWASPIVQKHEAGMSFSGSLPGPEGVHKSFFIVTSFKIKKRVFFKMPGEAEEAFINIFKIHFKDKV